MIIGYQKGDQTLAAIAKRLGDELSWPVSEFNGNPVCCLLLEPWTPNYSQDEYLMIKGGTGGRFLFSGEPGIDAAMARLKKMDRSPNGRIYVPNGVYTNWPVYSGEQIKSPPEITTP